MDSWGFYAVFTPAGAAIVAAAVVAAMGFLGVMFAISYRDRQSSDYPEQVAERAQPDADPPYPDLAATEEPVTDALPLTHNRPATPWSHS